MTPTAAFATRIRRITRGSTNAPNQVDPSESSSNARTKDTIAEARRIRTSWSLNCSRISSHSGVAGSSGSTEGKMRGAGTGEIEKRTISSIELGVFIGLVFRESSIWVYSIVVEDFFGRLGPGSFHSKR